MPERLARCMGARRYLSQCLNCVRGGQMTFYEVACRAQSIYVDVAEASIKDGYMEKTGDDNKYYRATVQEQIDRAYVLGLMIDSMPVELAEKEI